MGIFKRFTHNGVAYHHHHVTYASAQLVPTVITTWVPQVKVNCCHCRLRDCRAWLWDLDGVLVSAPFSQPTAGAGLWSAIIYSGQVTYYYLVVSDAHVTGISVKARDFVGFIIMEYIPRTLYLCIFTSTLFSIPTSTKNKISLFIHPLLCWWMLNV